MKAVILDDKTYRAKLFPFTEMRHLADIRVGIFTIREKWELQGFQVFTDEQDFQHSALKDQPCHTIPANRILASELMENYDAADKVPEEKYRTIVYPWDIFLHNDWAIRQDFEWVRQNGTSGPIPESVQVTYSRDIFIEPGAKLAHCVLNAAPGPIYIGRNAEIMEGTTIRGPFALGEGAVVKMGSRIYGATTVGPYSVVGGEIKNSVIFGYSNKAHHGYLGDSVIAEWCNLGAGSSNSNVKNSGAEVKVWENESQSYIAAGRKCGLLMGDFSRAAINSSFNTGTVVGIGSNIFGEGLLPKFIPSFRWGCVPGARYEFGKALEAIRNWKRFKNHELSEKEIQRLKHIFEHS
jgi:UDP-N-acetylglucosamine diphosphorylase/glucosamine-1-phosphate N-acetyltransferase